MYRTPYDEDFKRSIVTLFQNGKSHIKKSDCHIHAGLEKRLNAE